MCLYPDDAEGPIGEAGAPPTLQVQGQNQALAQAHFPVVNGSGRQRLRRSSSSRDSPPGPSSSSNAAKRKRPNEPEPKTEPESRERSSRIPLDGPASREDLHRLVDGLHDSVEDLQRAVRSHRCEPLERHTLRPHPDPLPERCSAGLLERMLAALPPQVDCEVMLEYLLQEVRANIMRAQKPL